MARILFTTKNMAGLLNPLLEMARRLKSDGHDVCFLGSAAAHQTVTAHGFRMIPLTQDRGALDRVKSAQGRPRLHRLRVGWTERRMLDNLAEVCDAIEHERPDLLIHDIEMHAFIIATAQMDIPAIITTPWCSVYRDSSVAPMHTATDPTQDRFGIEGRRSWAALIIRRLWAQEVVRRFRPSDVVERWTNPYLYHIIDRRVLVRLARVHGFPVRRSATQLNWLLPHIYKHLPVVSTVMSEFDLPQTAPANFRYVGPMVREEPVDVAIAEVDRQIVDEALALAATPGRYLVYFSVGTRSLDTFRIARNVIDAYAYDDEAVVLLSLGDVHKFSELGVELPPHIFAVNYSPQFEVLGSADLAIIHGGIGTINQCIYRQVPMVVHMFGDVDQPGCALRVHHHGLGQRIDLLQASPEELRSTATAVRADPSIAAALADFARNAARYRDNRVIERFVDEVLADRPSG